MAVETHEKERLTVKIHPRESIVLQAEREILLAIAEATRKLTVFETVRVLTNAMSQTLSIMSKYGIRNERHGGYGKPGGVADADQD